MENQLTTSPIKSNPCLGVPDQHPVTRTRAKKHDLQNVQTVDCTEPEGLRESTANSQKEMPSISTRIIPRGTGTTLSQNPEIENDLHNIFPSKSVSDRHVAPIEHDLNNSSPGEMIDDGMEWLQSLFANGLDANLLPVWD